MNGNKCRQNLLITFGILFLLFAALSCWMFYTPVSITPRLNFGRIATPGEFPSMVSIGPGFCGGTIIHENFVITSYDCVNKGDVYNFVVGEIDQNKFKKSGQWRYSEKVHKLEDDDVCLVYIPTPFKFSEKVKPAFLPKPNHKIPDMGITAGWGYTNFNCTNVDPKILKISNVDIQDTNSPLIIMAKKRDSVTSITCPGDSGSGLMEKSKYGKTHIIIGVSVAIKGELCGEFYKKYYFMSTTYFLRSIKSVMKQYNVTYFFEEMNIDKDKPFLTEHN